MDPLQGQGEDRKPDTTRGAVFRTIQFALDHLRSLGLAQDEPKEILLSPGVHFLADVARGQTF